MESTEKFQQMLDELKNSERQLEIANTAAEINSAVVLLEAVNVDAASESLKATLDVLAKSWKKDITAYHVAKQPTSKNCAHWWKRLVRWTFFASRSPNCTSCMA